MELPESSAQGTPPPADTFEISLFGPGIGECVVVHFGGGRWLVVDSCLNPTTKRAVALDYLECLGVSVEAAVEFVAVSHWHDDHIRGISDLLSEARSARFVLSSALRAAEFEELLNYSLRHVSFSHTSGLDEMRYCLTELKRREGNLRTPLFAMAQRSLLDERGLRPVEIRALSPSDAAKERAMVSLARLLPRVGQAAPRTVPNPRPNETSVVFWVRCGPWRALLGSDLEETGSGDSGWSAIVETGTHGESQIFKVAHHGSPTGHHEGIWTDLVGADGCAVLTPFLLGRRPLPAQADVRRLVERAGSVYVTRPPKHLSAPSRDRSVEKTMKEATRFRRPLVSKMGQVRVRLSCQEGAAPQVELFGAALRLDQGS